MPPNVTPAPAKPTVFLDRDGVINTDVGYLTEVSMLRLLPGAAAGIARLNRSGIDVIVVTNQSAIGRGLMGHDRLQEIHAALAQQLSRSGAGVDSIQYCPHTPAERCGCRKPAPGLLRRAGEERAVDFSRSYLVGDKSSDLKAGREAGCHRCLLIPSNHTSPDAAALADLTFPNLFEAASYIANDVVRSGELLDA